MHPVGQGRGNRGVACNGTSTSSDCGGLIVYPVKAFAVGLHLGNYRDHAVCTPGH
jgi:hypothetical protein